MSKSWRYSFVVVQLGDGFNITNVDVIFILSSLIQSLHSGLSSITLNYDSYKYSLQPYNTIVSNRRPRSAQLKILTLLGLQKLLEDLSGARSGWIEPTWRNLVLFNQLRKYIKRIWQKIIYQSKKVCVRVAGSSDRNPEPSKYGTVPECDWKHHPARITGWRASAVWRVAREPAEGDERTMESNQRGVVGSQVSRRRSSANDRLLRNRLSRATPQEIMSDGANKTLDITDQSLYSTEDVGA